MKKILLAISLCCIAAFTKAQNAYQFVGFGDPTNSNLPYLGQDSTLKVPAINEQTRDLVAVTVGPDLTPNHLSGDQIEYICYYLQNSVGANISMVFGGCTTYNPKTGAPGSTNQDFHYAIKSIDKSGNIKTVYPRYNSGTAAAPIMRVPASFHPQSMAADASGNVYIADAGNNMLFRLNASSGQLDTVLAGIFFSDNTTYHSVGPLSGSESGNALCFDASGNLLIADYKGNTILKFNPAAPITPLGTSTTSNPQIICGIDYLHPGTPGNVNGDGGPASAALLNHPSGIAYDNYLQYTYIVDRDNGKIRMISATGNIYSIAGSGGSTGDIVTASDAMSATSTSLMGNLSNGIAVDASGYVYFGYRFQILRVNPYDFNTTTGTGTTLYRYANTSNTDAHSLDYVRSETSGSTPISARNIALTGTSGGMSGLAFDNAGHLFVTNVMTPNYGLVIGSSYNRAPFFTAAAPSISPVCQNSTSAITIPASSFPAQDYDGSQTLTWSIGTTPHGTLRNAAGTVLTTGSTLNTPIATGGVITMPSSSNFNYTPDASYTGSTDEFTVIVSDNLGAKSSIKVTITLNPAPTINSPATTAYACGNTVTYTSMPAGTWGPAVGSHANITSSGIVTGTSAGSSIITCTIAATGCYTTSPVTVAATPAHYAIGAAFGRFLCAGNTLPLTNNTTVNAWTSSNSSIASVNTQTISGGQSIATIFGVAAGTAVITYTTPSLCPVALTDTMTVRVNALPATPPAITYTTSSIIINHSTTLSEPTLSGVWTANNSSKATVSATGVVSGHAAGSTVIYFTVTNAAGCSAAVGKLITVTASKDVYENNSIESVEGIKVYPNPSNGVFSVDMASTGNGTITIIDLNGRVIEIRTATNATESFDLQGKTAAGTYIIRVDNEAKNYTQKIVVY